MSICSNIVMPKALCYHTLSSSIHQESMKNSQNSNNPYQILEDPYTIDPHLSEPFGTKWCSDDPNIRVCQIMYFQ